MAMVARRVEGMLTLILMLVTATWLPRPTEARRGTDVMLALKEYWWDRNPYVTCMKKSWPHCLKSFAGINGISCMLCPTIVYWDCSWAWRLGHRRPFDAFDPNLPSV